MGKVRPVRAFLTSPSVGAEGLSENPRPSKASFDLKLRGAPSLSGPGEGAALPGVCELRPGIGIGFECELAGSLRGFEGSIDGANAGPLKESPKPLVEKSDSNPGVDLESPLISHASLTGAFTRHASEVTTPDLCPLIAPAPAFFVAAFHA